MGKSLISIDTLGFDICSDLGDSTYRHKAKINRHLISGYAELNRYIGTDFNVKSAILQYDNAIELPCDFVYETKVGVKRGDRIAVLMLDNNVERQKLNDTEMNKYLFDIWDKGYDGNSGYWFYNVYFGNRFLGELYGAGRSVFNNGTYNINRKDGVIYIGSNIPKDAEIIIEYKSDGISEGLKLVPIEMKECLTYYAKWQYYMDRDNARGANNERLYKQAYNKLQRLYNFENALYATTKISEMFSPTNY